MEYGSRYPICRFIIYVQCFANKNKSIKYICKPNINTINVLVSVLLDLKRNMDFLHKSSTTLLLLLLLLKQDNLTSGVNVTPPPHEKQV